MGRSVTQPTPQLAAAPALDRALTRLEGIYATYLEEDRAGRVVVIEGPRGQWGQGLLDAFKRHVVSRREPWFEAACEGSSGRTYGPLRDLLSQYLNHLEVLGLVDEELARRFAEVGAFLGMGSVALSAPVLPAVRATGSTGGGGQAQFYEQLGELLQECSERCPAVLGLRDLHLADSTTRAAVRFVVEHHAVDSIGEFAPADIARRRFRSLLVMTTESDAGLPRALSSAAVERVSLAGVDLETVRRFLQAPEVVERFLASSAGSPDNLRALVDDLPLRVDDLFTRRLARLDAEARGLLEVLAVYDRPVTPELLARLGEVAPQSFATIVGRLVDERLVSQRVHRGQFQLQLATPQAQRLIVDALDAGRRTHLHDAIGRLLEERMQLGHTIDPEELAYHFIRSDDDARAVEYALSAAERLHMTFAYQRAAEFLVAVLPRLTDAERRRGVLERLVDLHGSLSEHRCALRYCGLLKAATPVDERDEVYRRVGRVLLQMGRYALALRVLERARAVCEARTDEAAAVEELRILSAMAEAHYGLGQHDQAESACAAGLDRAVSVAHPAAAEREQLALRNTRGKILIARQSYDEALALFALNTEQGRRRGWPDEQVRGLFNCGIVWLLRKDFTRAERIFSDCLDFDHSTSNPITRAFCLLNIAVIYHQTLRWNQALEYYLHSLATFRTVGSNFQYVAAALNVGELYLELGDLQRARALVSAAGGVLEQHEIHHYRAWMSFLDGRIALEQGSLAEARERMESARRIAVEKQWSKSRELFIELAEVCHRLGDDEGYAHHMALDAERGESDETLAQATRLRGLVAWARDDLDEALRELEAAADLFESSGRLHPLWEVQHELALLECVLEREVAARARLEGAREIVTGLVAQVPESLRSRFTARTACMRLFASLEALQNGRSPLEAGLPPLVAEAVRRRDDSSIMACVELDACAASPDPSSAVRVRGSRRERYARIIGDAPQLHEIFRRVDRVARSESPVLVLGESGTGKELLADAIHRNSDRASGPFVKVNCGAFVETLLLSELFGHEKGAFTGALSRKVGRFEQADGGTLFLDEVGDISPNTQVALLRVLQEGTFERVGGSQTLDVNVRVVCATNRNLEQLVKTGQFRLDLYYRLKGVVFELPPLRERPGDVPLLIEHFLRAQASASDAPQTLSRAALRKLLCYSWPGNIRELQNFVRSLALFVPGSIIELDDVEQFADFFSDGELREPDTVIDAVLDQTMRRSMQRALHGELPAVADDTVDTTARRVALVEAPAPADDAGDTLDADGSTDAAAPEDRVVDHVLSGEIGLNELKKKLEIECIRRALIETDGNITQAARLLQIKRPRLSQIVNSSPELEEIRSGGRS